MLGKYPLCIPDRRRNVNPARMGCRSQSLASIIISFIRLGILGILGIVWADFTVGCRLLCGVLQVSWSQVQPFRRRLHSPRPDGSWPSPRRAPDF